MIKVLVVDDDKLVRKGLILAMPWQEFGMQVVGEASNGQKALEFLESQPVDLLLTDLAMPVMSGIELIRAARKRDPNLHMVVLTFHQDFEYIQEALRLGAIDYIAKVELEKAELAEVLGRIADRIKEQARHNIKAIPSNHAIIGDEQAYVLVSLDREPGQSWLQEMELPSDETIVELDRNSWMWLASNGEESHILNIWSEKVTKLSNSVILILSDFQGCTRKEIQQWVREYTEKVLFYEYQPDCCTIAVSMKDDHYLHNEIDELQLERVKERWLLFTWFHNDALYEKLIQDMKMLRLHETQLLALLYSLAMEWNRLFTHTKIGKIQMIDTLHSWFQVEQWIGSIRRNIQESSEHTEYSQEIVDCITKAVLMIEAELERQITAVELAQRLNLSRSYFSQCFKNIIGKPFNEYSRSIRIKKAKEYLLNTNKPIVWIAAQTGPDIS
jgi:two-component system response regulator YesN